MSVLLLLLGCVVDREPDPGTQIGFEEQFGCDVVGSVPAKGEVPSVQAWLGDFASDDSTLAVVALGEVQRLELESDGPPCPPAWSVEVEAVFDGPGASVGDVGELWVWEDGTPSLAVEVRDTSGVPPAEELEADRLMLSGYGYGDVLTVELHWQQTDEDEFLSERVLREVLSRVDASEE